MERQINGGLVAAAAFLIVGSIAFPNGAGMWLASTSITMNIFRVVLLAGAIFLLVTEPPRSKSSRTLLSIVAAVLFCWSVARVFDGTVQVMDALVALLASISFGIAALEISELPAWQIDPVQPPQPVPSIFATNVLAISDMQGMVIARRKIRNKAREMMLFLAIAISAFYKGSRPYRSLWRGG